ncbi:MAG: hypothetical protein DWQ40_03150 [Actinobacteria bacterium]|nr:MAG: hypothetical protein DWQ40_03150 [Actinomycetota bacterium]
MAFSKDSRTRTGRRARWAVGGGIALALLILLVYLIINGNGLLVGLVLTLLVAWGTGLILERVDQSRRAPEDRDRGPGEPPDGYWGYRGRPGS